VGPSSVVCNSPGDWLKRAIVSTQKEQILKIKIKIKAVKVTLSFATLALATLSIFQVNSLRAAIPQMAPVDRLNAIEEIHQLKARYIRCMDMKDWVCWRGVFAPDFHLKAGELEFHSAQEMVEGTKMTGLYDRVKTVSHAYTPDIEILSPTTARGTWACDFLHYWPAGTGTPQGKEIVPQGQWNHTDGYYHDTYVKIDGRWYIQSEEIQSIRDTQGHLGK
jgi:hypothetical protein